MNNLIIQSQNNSLCLRGALRATDAIEFKPQLLEQIATTDRAITIDITEVTDIDITGLNSLLMGKKLSNRLGKKLAIIVGIGHPIFELVHLTKFTKFIELQVA